MGILGDIAAGNRLKTSAELRSILGTYHPPCPECGCGTAGIDDNGNLVCFGCREDLYDSPRFAIRVFLKRTPDCPPGQYLVVDWDEDQNAIRKGRLPRGSAIDGRGGAGPAADLDFDQFVPGSRPWGYRADGTKPAASSAPGGMWPPAGTVEDWQAELKETARAMGWTRGEPINESEILNG